MSTLADHAREHTFKTRIHSWYLSKSLTHEVMRDVVRLHYPALLAIYRDRHHFYALAASFRAYIMNDDVYWAQPDSAAHMTVLNADFCVCAMIASTEHNFPFFMQELNVRAIDAHHTEEMLRDVHAAFLQVMRNRAVHDMAERCVSSCPADIFECIQSVFSSNVSNAQQVSVLQRIQGNVELVSRQRVNMRIQRRDYRGRQEERFAITIEARRPAAHRHDCMPGMLCFAKD